MTQQGMHRGQVNQPTPGIWRFGKSKLDERLASLDVDGRQVELDRSGYDVLLALLRHAGEVVTKDELLAAGWPDRVVSENSLAKAISRLRQALGSDGALLKAVHGYGYRLASSVDYSPLPQHQVQAYPLHAERLHPGDPLPHRPGWRLLERLGQGSAGVTWLAEGDGQRRAVKFASSEAGLRSLKREINLSRYIQSVRPDLPGVAPVLGSNLSLAPFFLEMPYYEHGNLQDWAARGDGLANLALSERLALFASLCDAVAALHELGVIHKDIKPGNLYPLRRTGADGVGRWQVVISDLGAGEAAPSPHLARLDLSMSLAVGRPSPQAGSLMYLAPEVVAGEMPTQRSDVFALGVLLYQLVTGDLRRPLAPGWEHDVGDELLREDIALSAAAKPQRRQLDAHALATRVRQLPERRAQLAQHRQDERERERLRQLVERQRARRPWRIATAAVLLAGVATSSALYYKALSASREAQRSAEVAKAVNRFLNTDVLGAASPYSHNGNHELTVREALDRAVDSIDERLRGQPVVEASVRLTIGQVYGEAMQIEQAIAQEQLAVALFERHLGVQDVRTQQARYRLAIDLTDDSRFEQAKALIDATDHERRRRGQTDLETRLAANHASCYWHIRSGRYEAGLAPCTTVVAVQQALDPNDLNAMIKARGNVAALHSRAGRHELAEREFSRIDEAFGSLGDQASPTRLRATFLHGMNLLAMDRLEQAQQMLEAAHRGAALALGAENPHTLEAQLGLARLHMRRAQPLLAVRLLQQVVQAYERQMGADNHYTVEARAALQEALCSAGGGASPCP